MDRDCVKVDVLLRGFAGDDEDDRLQQMALSDRACSSHEGAIKSDSPAHALLQQHASCCDVAIDRGGEGGVCLEALDVDRWTDTGGRSGAAWRRDRRRKQKTCVTASLFGASR